MKLFKNISGVLSLIFSVAALTLFFVVPYASVVYGDVNEAGRVGAEFAFGVDWSNGFEGAKSSHVLFNIILIVLTVIFAAVSFFWKKAKNIRWATVAFSFITTIYMLVIACNPAGFLDLQGLIPEGKAAEALKVGITPFLIFAGCLLTFVCSSAYLLICDKIRVMESNGELLPIPKRIIRFLRDYKGEIKKIVWPGPKAVVKNTFIVLVMCLLIGIVIWAVDFGLKALLDLIYVK